ncbi:MAG: NapC/NirT family cytochrome c [Candidatus Rokubacteria bacterium]|nr:NapC/NirT family cytochrome c [Candidatus Rokubacteria bacterium]
MAAGIVGFAAGAAITDRLEQDNRFCIACHRPEKPLHAKVYETFFPVGGTLRTLAAAHNATAQVKCIDCHIGAQVKDYLVVKAMAAWDAGRWIAGAYTDPERLRYPLGDRTCLKCHPDGGQNPKLAKAFHNAPYHRDPRNGCSDCHRSHLEASAETRFLQTAIAKPLCDGCHQAILGIPAR